MPVAGCVAAGIAGARHDVPARAIADSDSAPISLLMLRLRAGDSRVVVASAPNSTSKLIYHGGLAGLGTLYWENAEGLKHAAALFAAPSAEAAHELVRRWGVTHVVYFSWDPFAFTMTKLARGLPPAAPLPADAFIVRLLASPVPPPWLEAVPFEIPPHSAIEGDQIRIWRVVPEQSPADATAHAASCALELGEAGRARQLGAALAAFPADLNARVMAAAVAAADRNSAAFSRELERVTALLPRASGLSLEDRLHLVVVLAVGNRLDAARSQLRLCMAAANDSDLRHLTPGTLSDFLSLANALGVDFPDPALRRLAERLLPPIRRK